MFILLISTYTRIPCFMFFKYILFQWLFTFASTLICALSDLRQFLAIESPLKMMKNAFYFSSNTLFVLKIFKFLSRLFGHVGLDWKGTINFEIRHITARLTNNCNTHIVQYIEN